MRKSFPSNYKSIKKGKMDFVELTMLFISNAKEDSSATKK